MISSEDARKLVAEAESNHGKCTHCHSKLAIYKYPINKQIVKVLKTIRSLETPSDPYVNFDDVKGEYRLESQRTKMRLHGLIVQKKNDDGSRVGNTWRITSKGYQFLSGNPIEKYVIVFKNQVIGHEGGMITIGSVTGEASDVFNQQPVTEVESKVYSEVRSKPSDKKYEAKCIGGGYGLEKNEVYIVKVSKLAIGRPIMIGILGTNDVRSYKDVADFQRHWQILKEVE